MGTVVDRVTYVSFTFIGGNDGKGYRKGGVEIPDTTGNKTVEKIRKYMSIHTHIHVLVCLLP